MKIHRSNLESYLFDALLMSTERDKQTGGVTFVSGNTAALRDTLKAVRNGEPLEYFDVSE